MKTFAQLVAEAATERSKPPDAIDVTTVNSTPRSDNSRFRRPDGTIDWELAKKAASIAKLKPGVKLATPSSLGLKAKNIPTRRGR